MNDIDTTQQMPVGEPPDSPPTGRKAKRLLRSRSDRMLGGVAGGLADYFDVDPVIFRIGFAVTLFFGGLGFVLYLAAMIFVPSETVDGELPRKRTFGRVVLFTGAAVVGFFGLLILGLIAAWAGATGTGWLVALIVIAIGTALVGAAFKGGARWLIVPALALAIPLGTVAAADVEFDGPVGESTHRPLSEQSIPTAGYEHGVGEQRIDLRELDWKSDSVIRVKTEQGIGHTVVFVPENVCVDGTIETDYGVVEIAGSETTAEFFADYNVTPRLELDAHLDVGKLEVVNDDDAPVNRGGFSARDSIGRDELADRMAAACAPEPDREEVGKR